MQEIEALPKTSFFCDRKKFSERVASRRVSIVLKQAFKFPATGQERAFVQRNPRFTEAV